MHRGKQIEEGIGYTSEGWSAQKAAGELAKLKEAHRTGKGAQTLAEKRQLEKERREAEQIDQARKERAEITFSEFFTNTYKPILQMTKKPGSIKAEKILFEKWIDPAIGKMPFKDISHCISRESKKI